MRVLQFHGYSSRILASLPMQSDGSSRFLDGDIIDLGRGNVGVVWDGWVFEAAGKCSAFESVSVDMRHGHFLAARMAAIAVGAGQHVDAELIDASGWMFEEEFSVSEAALPRM